jgi:16S rRNA (cytosine967-C5)-methyltransferase
LDGGDPGGFDPVRDGRAAVQDEGSQLCAIAVATAPLDGRDERWLDMCAGPGGKAAVLAGLAAPRAARLTAVELRPHRAELVRAATAAWDVDVVVADAAALPVRTTASTGSCWTRRAPAWRAAAPR